MVNITDEKSAIFAPKIGQYLRLLAFDDDTLAARQTIDGLAESTLQPRGKFSIKATNASLIRYGSTTHNMKTDDQRRIVLYLWTAEGDSYKAALPTETGALLPGPWMLFILNDNGVPSISKTIYIQL